MKKQWLIVLMVSAAISFFSGSSHLFAASGSKIKLKFAHHIPSVTLQHKFFLEYADRVKKETNGQVEITVYGDGTLVRMEDCLDAVKSGITDIGWLAYAYEATQMGLNIVMRSITFHIPTAKDGRLVWKQLLDEFPEMREEVKDYKVLVRSFSMSGNDVHTTEKPVRVPSDLKGLKIIATGEAVKLMKAAGAIPLSLGSPDWYMSLERKLGDGVFAPLNVADSRGCVELLPYHTDMHLGRGIYSAIMSKKKWDSLPADVQTGFEAANEWLADHYPESGIQCMEESMEKARKLEQRIYKPTIEEMRQWWGLGKGLTEEWIQKMERIGKPGKAVYERAVELTKQFE